MGIIDRYDGIEWDDGNVWKNWKKHRVAPFETKQALKNEPYFDYDAEKYPGPEKRRVVLSRTDTGRYLFIVYTERKGKLRPICTRPMHENERKIYHDKTQTNP